MATKPTPDELTAEAEISEASAMARANTLIDKQETEVSSARLDAVLQIIDILTAARFVEDGADILWLLPAMGYPVTISFINPDEEDDTDEDGDD